LVAVLAACGDGEVCDVSDFEAALAEGGPVTLGACRIPGPIVIPDGVSVRGAGTGATIIDGDGVDPALTLGNGASLSGVTVQSPALIALLARGAGPFTLENVEVVATDVGLGLGVQGATRLDMTDVVVRGPVTTANVNAFTAGTVKPDTGPSHGLMLVDVADAQLDRVTVSGFAEFGALISGGVLRWTGGGASDNRGNGVVVHAGVATLVDLELCRTMRGIRLRHTYGAAFTGGSTITSSRLTACDGAGLGVFHQGGAGTHAELLVEDNESTGFWAHSTSGLSVGGRISGNRYGGLAAVDATGVRVRDLRIADTRIGVTLVGTHHELGDGLSVLRSTSGVSVQSVSLVGNERVGLLLELDAVPLAAGAISDVEVRASAAMQLGAIAQGTPPPAGWDDQIQRDAQTAAADSTFVGTLETVEIVGPCFFPAGGPFGSAGLSSLGI